MLKDQPGSMIIANNLASLLSDHRKDKASLERARSLALLLRNSPLPQFKDTVGWIDYQQGDYRAAIASLKDAATQMANVALVHYHLGMSYLAIGETAKASQEFKKARELAPNDAELKSKIDAALSDRPRNNKG
jgi:tetratricopeptide (TPR) repeat protein